MQVTTSKLIRGAGVSAMAAGLIFAGILPLPLPVDSTPFSILTVLKPAMSIFGLLGITGLYARQVKESGWLGLVGYLLLTMFFAFQTFISLVETTVLPVLTNTAPAFVEGVTGLQSASSGAANLGALNVVYPLTSILFILGLLVFGIAMFRAHILPRAAVILFAISGPLAGILFSLLPDQLDLLTGLPTGLGLLWLGYALFAERGQVSRDMATVKSGMTDSASIA